MRKGFGPGSRHTPEARAKISAALKGRQHSDERKAKMSAANKGKVREHKYSKSCVCGQIFTTGSAGAKFCSTECRRAARGHGIRHAPAFKCFAQLCAICGQQENLVGDHDHATGRPRGILCRNCNVALGNMRDDPARLRAAEAYLENSK